MNPILGVRHLVPDVEAHQWPDGRMYLYGSYDISGNPAYCSCEQRVFSSSDLIHWTDHGVCFKSHGEDSDVEWVNHQLYAPDCAHKGSLYYMYYCMSNCAEGVAASPSPWGPFQDLGDVGGAHLDSIDPAVLVDDDGQAYYYWGQFNLRAGRLQDDMRTLIPETINRDVINEAEHGFHEGASIRKRGDTYYLSYTDISRGRATCIGYATGKSPLGPFRKGGILIDNTGCDRETWNNHGSIAEFNGRWYIFYHRSSQASIFNRRVCAEPIFFEADGSIREVEMTTQGVEGPLNPYNLLEAYRACLLSGNLRTAQSGPSLYTGEITEYLSQIQDKDWAAYKYLNFDGHAAAFEVKASSMTYGGEIEIRLDAPDGKQIGTCSVPHTGGWEKWQTCRCRVEKAEGVHALYLVFMGNFGRLMSVESFRFVK